MKLVLFSLGFAGGGAEQVFVHLANHWKRSGHQVEYWVIRKQGPLRTRLNPNIPVVVLGSGVRALQRLTLTCYLRKLLASRKPDAIFSTVTYANCLLGGAAGGLQQTGTVTVLREANVLENIRKTGWLQSLMTLRWMRRTYPNASAILVNAAQTAKEIEDVVLAGRGSPPVSCIPNPVPPEPEDITSVPARYPKQGTRRLVACGRLIPQKGFDTLLRAAALLPAHLCWELVILGEGAERENLKAMALELGIKDRLVMPGFVDDVRVWFRGADLFVLSSRWEGFPNVLVEALACGTPAVVTDCPGACQTMVEGVPGTRLVPVDDPGKLAEAIEGGLQETVDRAAIRAVITERYGIDTIADAYLALASGVRHAGR